MGVYDNGENGEADEDASLCNSERSIDTRCQIEDRLSGAESFKSSTDGTEVILDDAIRSSQRSHASSSYNMESEDGQKGEAHNVAACAEGTPGSSFTFMASSSHQGQSTVMRRKTKKKPFTNAGCSSSKLSSCSGDSFTTVWPSLSSEAQSVTSHNHESINQFTYPSELGRQADSSSVKGGVINLGLETTSATPLAAQEACQKWRLRGNQAYTSGDALKAEECYTQGINSIQKDMASRSCSRALMLCYSNRAAVRMSLGRLNDAIQDCMMAISLDPYFFKVELRAAKYEIPDLGAEQPLVDSARELLHLKVMKLFGLEDMQKLLKIILQLCHAMSSRALLQLFAFAIAAAYKASGQILDAIADCSLVIALTGNYIKAISRPASLFEMIRDYEQAAADLQRLVSALTKQLEENTDRVEGSDSLLSCAAELRQMHVKLAEMEEEARKDIPLDVYLILGVESSASLSQIKKAYRRAALRHHPDKATQFLSRNKNGDDKIWKAIAEEVKKDADRLFKMIGVAYAVLSDPVKRSRHDADEEMRKSQKKHAAASTPRTYKGATNPPPFERGIRKSHSEVWRYYSSQQAQRPESSSWTKYK
ncbi:hypothetical protein MLD38_004185 [Melastoma candidum]|uniref:Uncharacterized protein n=1 Tax=Melastoma candidum TaxID=119954 RepID=A0ACB9S9J7_9MYRT|nr:hypothetical protein MLD38_004185 [Melastoma candidum]